MYLLIAVCVLTHDKPHPRFTRLFGGVIIHHPFVCYQTAFTVSHEHLCAYICCVGVGYPGETVICPPNEQWLDYSTFPAVHIQHLGMI
jgi:hypothetical protein